MKKISLSIFLENIVSSLCPQFVLTLLSSYPCYGCTFYATNEIELVYRYVSLPQLSRKTS